MNEPLGMVAGNGQMPALLAQAARRRQIPVVAVGLRGETEPTLAEHVDVLHWVRPGQLGRMIGLLQHAGLRRAVLCGGVHKTRLLRGLWPDWRGLRLLAAHWVRRDDDMLRAVARCFAAAGVEIVDSTALMPEVLAPPGLLCGPSPSPRQWEDLRFGMQMAHRIGALDVGQTVVVKNGCVLAMEAIEGTDACIQRGGALGGRGTVVVKVAKPAQDLRFDLPAVGLQTLASLQAAQAQVLGVEAGRTVLLGPQAVLAAAERQGLTLVGLQPPAPTATP